MRCAGQGDLALRVGVYERDALCDCIALLLVMCICMGVGIVCVSERVGLEAEEERQRFCFAQFKAYEDGSELGLICVM